MKFEDIKVGRFYKQAWNRKYYKGYTYYKIISKSETDIIAKVIIDEAFPITNMYDTIFSMGRTLNINHSSLEEATEDEIMVRLI